MTTRGIVGTCTGSSFKVIDRLKVTLKSDEAKAVKYSD